MGTPAPRRRDRPSTRGDGLVDDIDVVLVYDYCSKQLRALGEQRHLGVLLVPISVLDTAWLMRRDRLRVFAAKHAITCAWDQYEADE